ncbi:P-loop containing nucleoside triphosphate hydrolase protein [Apodospora peruviana]|uniref:P-loop containing nucleoside triphosphate hydrolase protein n=1 Tax=Apodospora peruviana TaxID=516989 RepID=A0AAE0HZS0_9PEZI|nr:P-loop containing nucleoside triphosphate hydrolase protein [Apodospora peruviana]
MTSSPEESQRAGRLRGLFRAVLSGERAIKTSKDAELFLEAVRTQQPPSTCVEAIISSQGGLNAVRDSTRANLSAPFVCSHTLPFLRYLSDPAVKTLADGQLLQQLLVAIAHPPTVWISLLGLFKAGQIQEENMFPLAWLALELLLLPSKTGVDVSQDVQAIADGRVLLKSGDHATRELGYRIKNVLQFHSSSHQSIGATNPGGRHDNDHANFRDIEIYPTTDEFLSTQQPFYRTASEVFETDMARRPSVHIDNQFRQLREDMLAELREDIQVATGTRKGKRPPLTLGQLVPAELDVGDFAGRFKKCSLQVQCFSGLEFLQKLQPNDRRKFLKDQPTFLKHQSFGVLIWDKEIFGFAFVDRDVDLLAQSPPIVSLQFTDGQGLQKALFAFKLSRANPVRFFLVDTPVFAYEPVLTGLKEITDLPLHRYLVDPTSSNGELKDAPLALRSISERLKRAKREMSPNGTVELPSSGPAKVHVDASQLEAIHLALTRSVTLIQGPPGTGKSFAGAQIAKYLHEAGLRILVISYTNHALNQFQEDLLDVGISSEKMTRVGGSKSKCSDRTAQLLLSEQRGSCRYSYDARNIINNMKLKAHIASTELKKAFQAYSNMSITWEDISEYLEFSAQPFYDALLVPTQTDTSGWRQTGKGGKKVGPDYLYLRWIKGENPGIFTQTIPNSSHFVWDMPRAERERHVEEWKRSIMTEFVERVQKLATKFNNTQEEIDIQFSEAYRQTLLQKTVISCTTTGAAKYTRLVRAARPDVVLVEEAGEILESHILTSLAPTVKQLILIGDHKQLRPKINNYALSVEKGDGFDLNRSLFERLIMQGAAHTTLRKQHRMATEISRFPRELTYPDLLDGPDTSDRPEIRGLRDRVVFFNHSKQEQSDKALRDRRDPGLKESKKNLFESELVLRCVKYFGQQGYSSQQIVVLTPYLGQIRVLQDLLRKNQHDPELSEMDKMEFIRAGLMTEAAAKLDKKPLRLSTIDNYQGEESDIVIVSLTRSNESGDIGFMFAPERLNVLITRARNCLVMIGNMDTFMSSKKGRPTWHPFFELLKVHGHLYDGLPVKCEKHPEKTALLKEPIDFDKCCPDGGCTEPCNATIKCGIHKCSFRCHRVTDHSKTECNQLVDRVCGRQHKSRVRCARQNDNCQLCIKEDQEEERKIKRDLKLEEERMHRQEAYLKNLQEFKDKIDHQRRINRYHAEEEEQKKTLEQHKADLAALTDQQRRIQEQKKRQAEMAAQALQAQSHGSKNPATDLSANPEDIMSDSNTASVEWQHLKQFEGAQSAPMDELVAMVGLEEVKQEFLSIKSNVDIALRQGIASTNQRFGCSMLGNPGTGKTTVARLYARFLTEVGAIPGNCFKETTGSGLANAGVSGCKKLIEEILNDGGGVLFIDEAYQLTSGNNAGGGAVLDYLLAEVENRTGKIVFVLAGYNKQMESLFSHNPGIPSRFPIEMKFADYTDDELLRILELKINKKYNKAMDCEDGLRGLYCRIVARRIGRGRGKEGFGNARTVENTLDIISRRQGDRLRKERKAGSKMTNDFLFTKEDLIGPEPAVALTKCEAWQKLQKLIGLGAVKQAVQSLVDSIQQNYKREIAEQPLIEYSLNKVFVGNPGTGKTTVAKLYGAILVALGLLSKGEVVVRNPSDFVGGYLGQSEEQTKGILAAAVGKVLVIDEAYGLYGGGHGSSSDPYKTAVIDTIVAEVQSVPGDDRCVLLLGYRDQMELMFQNVNPGLQRRFPMSSAFQFDDFSDVELRTIFDKKLGEQGYHVTDQAAGVAMEMLKRARNRPNFGNAGEIDNILDATKARHQQRLTKGQAKSDTILEALDFDEDFDRAERSETNIGKLFEGTVGCEQTVALLEGYQDTVRTLKALDMDPTENIPFNFLFRGPPGTGKTTTAKKMGKVFYDMGFLATAEVVECSATDLIGMCVGQTGPKVQQLLDKALGKVLFVDEAYRLAEGNFAKEAMDEIVDSVTKTKYHKKLIIILAGYEADINRLMSINPGLTSRFPAVIDFRPLNADECGFLLHQLLQKQKTVLQSKGKDLDLSCLEDPSKEFSRGMVNRFASLAVQDNWASARDVQSIAKSVFNKLLRCKDDLANGRLTLTGGIMLEELQAMLDERESRATSAAAKSSSSLAAQLTDELRVQAAEPPAQAPVKIATQTQSAPEPQAESSPDEAILETPEDSDDDNETEIKPADPSRFKFGYRDPGVSDAVWEQLQMDREVEDEQEEEYWRLQAEAKKAAGAARDKIVQRLVEEERRRREEEERKKKLELHGICPAGFQWVKEQGGYRCTAGGHCISDAELEKL